MGLKTEINLSVEKFSPNVALIAIAMKSIFQQL